MFKPSLSLSRYLAILILALVIASAAYTLAAANSVTESGTGEGVADITDYEIDSSTIRYTLDDQTNPTDVRRVQFEVNIQAGSNADPPSEVYAQIDNSTWVSCTPSGGDLWECPFSPPYPRVRVSPPTALHVVAAQ
jgi:hypothetical protein